MSSEVKDIYNMADLSAWSSITRDLKPPPRLAVIGDPVAHSASPQLHNPALQHCGIDAQYVRIHVLPEELPQAVKLFAEHAFLGVNVTIPHKMEVAKLVDHLDPLAARIGAVNTLLFEDGQALGFNSDAPGFRQAVRDEFFVDLRDLRIMILGAGGGAGRAVAIQCAEDHCERLVLVNRTKEKAKALAEELHADLEDDRVTGPADRLKVIGFENEEILAEELSQVDLIINGTQLGMKRTDPEVLPAHLLQPHHLVYDMVYQPLNTRLMEDARSAGARATNGLGMLLWQGAVSFEYWFNRRAPVEVMRQGLRSTFGL